MAWARENRYTVFTNDLDYGALLFATAAASPSVIQIRTEDIRPASAKHAVLFALQAAGIRVVTYQFVWPEFHRLSP